MAGRYASFDRETLKFLEELAANNNREWFRENKGRYEEQVLDVALRTLLAEKTMSVRRFLVELMCHFSPEAAPLIVSRARGSVWYFQRNCAIILGRMRDWPDKHRCD